MAKPRKHAEALTKLFSVRLPESEYRTWQAKVQESGLSASEFFRQAVLANRTRIAPYRKPSPDIRRMLFLMNKTSNNINQLAHRAHVDHMAGVLSESIYTRILQDLETISRYVKAMVDRADPVHRD